MALPGIYPVSRTPTSFAQEREILVNSLRFVTRVIHQEEVFQNAENTFEKKYCDILSRVFTLGHWSITRYFQEELPQRFLQRREKALSAFEAALNQNPSFTPEEALEAMRSQGQTEEVANLGKRLHFERWLHLAKIKDPEKRVEALFDLADHYYLKGDFVESTEDPEDEWYNTTVELFPDEGGWIGNRTKHPLIALALYRSLVEQTPNNLNASKKIEELFARANFGEQEARVREIFEKIEASEIEEAEFVKRVDQSGLDLNEKREMLLAFARQPLTLQIAKPAAEAFQEISGRSLIAENPLFVGSLHTDLLMTGEKAISLGAFAVPTGLGAGAALLLTDTSPWRAARWGGLLTGGLVAYQSSEEHRWRNAALGGMAGAAVSYGTARFLKGVGVNPLWAMAGTALFSNLYFVTDSGQEYIQQNWEILKTPYPDWTYFTKSALPDEVICLAVDYVAARTVLGVFSAGGQAIAMGRAALVARGLPLASSAESSGVLWFLSQGIGAGATAYRVDHWCYVEPSLGEIPPMGNAFKEIIAAPPLVLKWEQEEEDGESY